MMEQLKKELREKNIIWVSPETENILAVGQLDEIFELLKKIAFKYNKEDLNMMPKLQNIELITGEVVEAVANANFKKGNIELMGIFLYDYTKIKYEAVKFILQKHFNIQHYN